MAEVVTIRVEEELDVGRARRAAAALCAQAGFAPAEAASVTTSVSELARNLWQHAGGGTITLRLEAEGDDPWIEVTAEDEGPGIADVMRTMQNGYSTGGGLGSGLPGVRRLMDEFHIESAPGRGTCVVARKWARRRR